MLRTNRDGFALPMSILLVGFMAAGLMAAYARIDNEHKIVRNAVNQVDAFTLAEAGLSQALANRAITPPIATYTFPGGIAIVQIMQVRPEVGGTPAMYLIRSEGRPTSGSLERPGRHIVSTYAYWEIGRMTVKSAWTTLSGMHYNGSAGVIDGHDQCGMQATLPGVMVPGGSYTYTSDNRQPAGDPPVHQSYSQEQLKTEVGIDWNAIVNEDAIVADYVLGPGDPWPSHAFNDPNAWPVIHVKKGFNSLHSLDSNGRGTLIVEGNLEIRGDTQWRGIILVGGNLIADGNNNVLGATVTSLNIQLGMDVPNVEVLNGQKTYAYDSCNVAAAATAFSTLRAMPNTWSDAWRYPMPLN